MPTVLVVDDEPVILKVLTRFLDRDGRTILAAGGAEEATRLAQEKGPVDLALVDKNLGEDSGLEVARRLKSIQPDTEVILVTGYASLQSAIEAVQLGLYDYVVKPIDDFENLNLKVSNALDKVRLSREHRRVQEELARSEARYRELFDSAPDAMVAFDVRTEVIHEANPAAVGLFGHAREELLTMKVEELFAPPRPPLLASGAWARHGVPIPCLRKDGGVFGAEVRLGDLALRGQLMRTITIRDVSERERLTAERQAVLEQLRHAQKMDAVGRLASGIGHDLGNLMAVVLTYSEALAASTQGREREDAEAIQQAGERAAHLVRQMMTLARKGPASPAAVSVNAAATETAKLLRRALGGKIELSLELAEDLWPVRADPGHLGQVLLNLAVNARDAMPTGGRLVVRTENVVLGERHPARAAGPAPGEYVEISVSDTGTGMSEDVRARLFEPFFTTKERGKGTGLGLAVTYGIVVQAGGSIAVESEPGKGATFRILLPRAQADARPAAAPAKQRPLDRSGTVLVAEDEDALRAIVVRSLSGLGLRVIEGRNGDEALAEARAHGAPIDLLLADVVLPGMSGKALADVLRRENPEMKVLLMTGFPGDEKVIELLEQGGQVLQKPFRQQALLDRVQGLLATG